MTEAPDPIEMGQTTVAIVTAILSGDFKSSTDMVDELEPQQVHSLVGGMAALFRGMSMHYAAVTGEDLVDVESEMLSRLGAVLAHMGLPS